MTRAVCVSLAAIVSVSSTVPRADAQASAQKRQASPIFAAAGKDPYRGIFRGGAQPIQPPMATAPLRDRPTVPCGMSIFHADPRIDPRIGAEPKLDGTATHKPTPKARIIEPKVCVTDSTRK